MVTDCMYLLKPPAPSSLPQHLTSPRTTTTTSLLLVLSPPRPCSASGPSLLSNPRFCCRW